VASKGQFQYYLVQIPPAATGSPAGGPGKAFKYSVGPTFPEDYPTPLYGGLKAFVKYGAPPLSEQDADFEACDSRETCNVVSSFNFRSVNPNAQRFYIAVTMSDKATGRSTIDYTSWTLSTCHGSGFDRSIDFF